MLTCIISLVSNYVLWNGHRLTVSILTLMEIMIWLAASQQRSQRWCRQQRSQFVCIFCVLLLQSWIDVLTIWDPIETLLVLLRPPNFYSHRGGWLPPNQHRHRDVLQCFRRSFWALFPENCPSFPQSSNSHLNAASSRVNARWVSPVGDTARPSSGTQSRDIHMFPINHLSLNHRCSPPAPRWHIRKHCHRPSCKFLPP